MAWTKSFSSLQEAEDFFQSKGTFKFWGRESDYYIYTLDVNYKRYYVDLYIDTWKAVIKEG